mmetsp:Transcript_5136/g.22165  ORF Transcript_5136/g.22165 Transcript_5136/m.22165 type:complete len:126 (-) Transcript_5136:625-1002(-)
MTLSLLCHTTLLPLDVEVFLVRKKFPDLGAKSGVGNVGQFGCQSISVNCCFINDGLDESWDLGYRLVAENLAGPKVRPSSVCVCWTSSRRLKDVRNQSLEFRMAEIDHLGDKDDCRSPRHGFVLT